jgi:Fe-S cluster assembly protein SufB
MPAVQETVDQVRRIDVDQYKYGFETQIESEKAPKGLSEDTIRFISAKKNEPEWMLAWRLDAYRRWLTMHEPKWAKVEYGPIDYQDIYYYSAPKKAPKSLDEIDPEILRTYEKLGIPLREREALLGIQKPANEAGEEGERGEGGYGRVAVDAVFDSVSVATTFKAELAKAGVLFMPISEAVHEHPELVKKYLGTVVPVSDNFFATLNSAVFSDGSFVYVPPGVRCPMELSTYFRINERNTGQFERTLIIADKGSYVSYLEGCTAPMRDENQLHAAVVELVALDDAEIKYSTIQNWYPAAAVSSISSPSAATAAARTPRSRGRRWRPAPPSRGNIRAASCAATIRAASSTRSPFPTAISRLIPAPRCCISARTRRAASSRRALPPGTRTTRIAGSSPHIAAPPARATSPTATRF